ncbi:MAG: 1-acyl-sn-glycerol-3-phosphate acyltransferase [Desulfuromonas sp.]|nr:1-acyl-sn-glycerol-3-phosphate acyltransferase [Desulfuromonas sp.]
MIPDQTWRFHAAEYQSPPQPVGWLTRTFPSALFYPKVIGIVVRCSRLAQQGRYDKHAWARSSEAVAGYLESAGCRIQAEGLGNLDTLDRPCVFIGNHMSTLETFVLPSMLLPRCGDLTFVVKRGLIEYPFFKHVMLSRNPVVVDRVNPRDDLKAVMEQGAERLAAGYSLIIFPQHTRSIAFEPEQFNSIGIKLAARTGAPVVPVALQTSAWSPGKFLKDYGPLFPDRPVHFAFGEPFTVAGKGNEEHQRVVRFIQEHLEAWRGQPTQG